MMTIYAGAFPYRLVRPWRNMADGRQARPYLPTNVRDEGEAFVLTTAVPGMKAEDLKISVLEDVVRIEGEFPRDENEYLLRELPTGAFARELRMPAALQAEQVEARIDDGMLFLRLPKAQSARPRSIKVEAK